MSIKRWIIAGALGLIAAAGPASLAAAQTSTEAAAQLKALNDRFKAATLTKRDYQEIREVRAELKKLIPALRTRMDETQRQQQLMESSVSGMRGQLQFMIAPPPDLTVNTPTGGFSSPPTPSPIAIDFYNASTDSLGRKVKELQSALPDQIEAQTKAIALLDAEATKQRQITNSNAATDGERAAAKLSLDQINQQLQAARRTKDRLQTQADNLNGATDLLAEIGKKETALAEIRKEWSELQKRNVEAENLLDQLDERVQNILSNDNAQNIFTTISTIVFATLVGCVIILFFVIAFKNQQVSNAIFSGESGIQFVTLFSLVIAIILFGVLHILEGKELAALLGGLSGYILGRGSQQLGGTNNRPPQNQPPQNQQPQNQPGNQQPQNQQPANQQPQNRQTQPNQTRQQPAQNQNQPNQNQDQNQHQEDPVP